MSGKAFKRITKFNSSAPSTQGVEMAHCNCDKTHPIRSKALQRRVIGNCFARFSCLAGDRGEAIRRAKGLTFTHLVFICSLLGGFFLITPCKAQLPGVNLGATSFLDGLPPPDGPGWYVEEYFQYYKSSRLLDKDGNEIALPTSRGTFETPHLQTWVMLTQFEIARRECGLLSAGSISSS
jgi:hypothetical protein